MAAPSRDEPVRKMPQAAPATERPIARAAPVEAHRKGFWLVRKLLSTVTLQVAACMIVVKVLTIEGRIIQSPGVIIIQTRRSRASWFNEDERFLGQTKVPATVRCRDRAQKPFGRHELRPTPAGTSLRPLQKPPSQN